MRKPDFVLDTERRDLLITKLTQITDWSSISKGKEIFHKSTSKITMIDVLDSVDIENGILCYINHEGIKYNHGLDGWYIYDCNAVDEVYEYTTPKMYMYKERLFVANNVDDLFKLMKAEKNLIGKNAVAFTDKQKQNIQVIEFVTGYRVCLE